MTIDYHITIGQPLSHSEKSKVQKILHETFEEINSIYNKWNPHSEISKLNQAKANVWIPLSSNLYHFLEQTQELVYITEGRFDPTIEPLQKLWKANFLLEKIPEQEEINRIIPTIGWNNIQLKEGNILKLHDQTSLDLGGIAKGYAVDLLVTRLNAAGFHNVYVEWGGEIRVSGQHPDKRPWRIYISRLGDTNPDHAIAELDLQDCAIATSGDYLQNWYIGNHVFFHIFDPKTYKPLVATSRSIASASVLAPTCMMADALATAALMFESVDDFNLWQEKVRLEHPKIEFKVAAREQLYNK